MQEVPARKPPTVRLRRLAKEMTRLRVQAGFKTREAAAAKLHMNPSTLYRMEEAQHTPLKRTVLVALELYGVNDPAEQARYLELRTRSSDLNWLAPYEQDLSDDYQAYINLELDAERLVGVENTLVPGLLQTSDYARALMRGVHPPLHDEEVERRAEVRARRQESLARKGTEIWMVIGEAVLWNEVGGPDVMHAQLGQLLEEDRKRITLQVVPFKVGAHPGSMGSFVIMQYPESDLDLVYIETLTSSAFLETEEEVAMHRRSFEYLIAQALSPDKTREMIAERRKAFG